MDICNPLFRVPYGTRQVHAKDYHIHYDTFYRIVYDADILQSTPKYTIEAPAISQASQSKPATDPQGFLGMLT
jgi:hypothetical protein